LFLSDTYPRSLGAEALRRLEVEGFPVTAINDIYGGDLYEEGKARYQVKAG
jgi:fumarate hydratase subunit beta